MSYTEIIHLCHGPGSRFDFERFRPGSPDRGCPACPLPLSEAAAVVIDERGRAWYAVCAGSILAEHTRFNEDRPRARYRWETPRVDEMVFMKG